MKNTLDTKETKQWRFASISICAPQWLHSFINEEIEKQAKSGAGLFSNETTIDEADETLDDLLMADAFNMKCSLEFYRKELAQYGIIGNGGLFNRDFTQMLFTALKAAVLCLKSDADKPMKARNDIAEIIKEFDNMPVWGLLFQILILQGLVSLLERLDIEEGDTGFDEGQGLCDWSFNLLLGKLVDFCYKPYGDGDKERLKPLCDFLMNTEAGNAVQSHIFGKTDNQQSENSNEAKTKQEKSQQLPGLSKTNGQGDKQNEHSEIDKEALKNLFGNAVFFANDYKERDTLNEKINLSRFDIFVEELESLLNDEHCNQTKIGNVAYMVHKSRFRKYIKFAPTCRLLFECCQLKAPKDQHANKYKHPDSDILQDFSDVLGNPVNPQK